jgi:hypothetical protein
MMINDNELNNSQEDISNLWDRQLNEPNKSYSYFRKYCELGTNRSLTKLCKKHTKTCTK